MRPDDPRARFVIAQYLLEEGRHEEALPLLRALAEDYPRVADWVERLERGEPLDTSELRWEPDMVRPLPPPQQRPRPKLKPGRALVAILMALSLFLPLLQMLTLGSPRAEPRTIDLARSQARQRVQMLCYRVVQTAIDEGRLAEEVGSCLDWVLWLPEEDMRAAVGCHQRYPQDERRFMACAIDAGIYPEGVRLPGTTDF